MIQKGILQTIFISIFLVISNLSTKAERVLTISSDSVDIQQTQTSRKIEIIETQIDTTLILPKSKPKYIQIYPLPSRNYRRLASNTGLFLGATIITFGVLYTLPENATQWDKEKMREEGITAKWQENVNKGPVIDSDNFFFNYVTHPWAGAVYYMSARSSGFKWWDSFLYSSLMSTFFWEYGIEAFAEVPSVQDIFVTPIVGSMFGEGFFYAKKSIMKHDKRILKSKILGITTLFLMDPFNTILDGVGYKDNNNTSMTIAPVGYNIQQKTAVWGANVSIKF